MLTHIPLEELNSDSNCIYMTRNVRGIHRGSKDVKRVFVFAVNCSCRYFKHLKTRSLSLEAHTLIYWVCVHCMFVCAHFWGLWGSDKWTVCFRCSRAFFLLSGCVCSGSWGTKYCSLRLSLPLFRVCGVAQRGAVIRGSLSLQPSTSLSAPQRSPALLQSHRETGVSLVWASRGGAEAIGALDCHVGDRK